MQYVFLSHDVDWRKQGPTKEHILARKDRFANEVIDNLDQINPYYNIPYIMELEDKLGVKSTFFFRTQYENGDLTDYQEEIGSLTKSGWEIGLHCDPSSISNIEDIAREKKELERITNTSIIGNRVHFLKFDAELPSKLTELGFVYDSSIRNSKDRIDEKEMGFYHYETLIEFPITIMDAYLFTHMGLEEKDIVPIFQKTLDYSRKLNSDFNIITVLWHDNVLKMKGGRMYPKILEFLTSQDDVKICRGIDLAKMINEKSLNY